MSSLMLFHAITGTLAVIAGFAALFAPKGSGFHRPCGGVFVITMLAMGVTGVILAIQMPLLRWHKRRPARL